MRLIGVLGVLCARLEFSARAPEMRRRAENDDTLRVSVVCRITPDRK